MKRSPLTRKSPLKQSTPLRRSPGETKRRPISPASKEQRRKIADAVSIVSGGYPCDPAHIWPRGMGGCDHPDCVIPLTRFEHQQFDLGHLDILPYLITHGCWAELAHAVLVHHVDPVSLLERTTGERWVPVEREVA